MQALECNLLVVTNDNIILCLERKLQLYNFKGDKEREWVLEAIIRCIHESFVRAAIHIPWEQDSYCRDCT